jgi:thiol:disulfide interchange protein/DsbC/DsbD-like thiol-disulfide interchange protein
MQILRHIPRYFFALTACFILSLAAVSAESSTPEGVDQKPSHVRLITSQDSVALGESFTLGIEFDITPGWHIYWKNHGDYGLKPSFLFGEMFDYGEVQWPTPHRITNESSTSYGYSGLTRFISNVTVPKNAQPGEQAIEVQVDYLICKVDCIPQKASLTMPMSIVRSEASSAGIPQRPVVLTPQSTRKQKIIGSYSFDETTRRLSAKIPLLQTFPKNATPLIVPMEPGIIQAHLPQETSQTDTELELSSVTTTEYKSNSGKIEGILLFEQEPNDSNPVAFEFCLIDSSTAKAPIVAATAESTTSTSLMQALLLAFLGGLLLNVMPCVLPVLSIKVFALLNMGDGNRKRMQTDALLYTLGVVASTVSLACTMLLLRAWGNEIGWGFHLQSPVVVAFLCVLFFVLGLQFLSPMTLGSHLSTISSRLADKIDSNTPWRALFDGMLAVAVATPCTAPFMATALGATLTMGAIETLGVFGCLGLGLASPFLLVSFVPACSRILPRPGAWMDVVKQVLAFPLLGASLWLITVLVALKGSGALLPALATLLLVSFVFWAINRSHSTYLVATWLTLGLISVAVFLNASGKTESEDLQWETYSPELHRAILADKELAYFDFTAKWCLTCQYNKARVFGSSDVRTYIKKNKVRLIRADWTDQDPVITKTLHRYQREGVPFNIVTGEKLKQGEEILPSILNPAIVLESLSRAKGESSPVPAQRPNQQ